MNSKNLITIDNAAQYLLDRELINTDSIVDGELKITNTPRKNRNIKVTRKGGTSFFIKQPNPGDTNSTVVREALLYKSAQSDSGLAILTGIIPRFIDFDYERNILITELMINGQSWNEYNYFVANGVVRNEHASMLGNLMSFYHKAFDKLVTKNQLHFLPKELPPVSFLIHPGPYIFATITMANLELLKIIQQYSSLHDYIERVCIDWSPQTLVHGDMKWDNIIISDQGERTSQMKIVDWESANIGDPAWDIAGVFEEFIVRWLYYLPTNSTQSPELLVKSTAHPLKSMQSAMRAFWFSYAKGNALEPQHSDELLIKSTRFCAARLVQTAYESLYLSRTLSNVAVYMVQTSLNIFNNTEDAIVHLLGIPFRRYL